MKIIQASPFVTICILLAGSAVGVGSFLGLGFSIAAIFRKRWFCYYICPAGLLLDWTSGIGFKRTSWWKRCPSIGLYTVIITMAGSVTVLRPPGVIVEDEFRGKCIRCGNCIRACPSKIIHPDIGETGILGFMAPAVSFNKGYCIETCNDCTKVCPSGALKKLNIEKKKQYSIGKAVLNPSICYMVRGVNDCDICVRSCSFEAVQTYWDEDSYVAFLLSIP